MPNDNGVATRVYACIADGLATTLAIVVSLDRTPDQRTTIINPRITIILRDLALRNLELEARTPKQMTKTVLLPILHRKRLRKTSKQSFYSTGKCLQQFSCTAYLHRASKCRCNKYPTFPIFNSVSFISFFTSFSLLNRFRLYRLFC